MMNRRQFVSAATGAAIFVRLPNVFAAAAPKYDFLNRLLAIGIGQAVPTGAVHEIEELV